MWVDQMLFSRFIAFFVALSFFVLDAQQTKAETVLYCSDELATGLNREAGTWEEASFKLLRRTLKITGEFDKILFEGHVYDCSPAYDDTYKAQFVTCFHTAFLSDGKVFDIGGLPKLFAFNTQTMRYTFLNGKTSAYIGDGPDVDTDSFYAGKCEKF